MRLTVADGADPGSRDLYGFDPSSKLAIGTWFCHGFMMVGPGLVLPKVATIQEHALGEIVESRLYPPDQLSDHRHPAWRVSELRLGGELRVRGRARLPVAATLRRKGRVAFRRSRMTNGGTSTGRQGLAKTRQRFPALVTPRAETRRESR